jgi:ATP-dependent RNA helicase RhlE
MKMTGRATSFVTFEERDQLCAIERLLGHSVPLAEGSPSSSERSHVRGGAERSSGDHKRWGRPGEDRGQHQPSPSSYRRGGSRSLRSESAG